MKPASAHDHHAVLTALLDPDGEAARAAMGRHITGAEELLAEQLGAAVPPAEKTDDSAVQTAPSATRLIETRSRIL